MKYQYFYTDQTIGRMGFRKTAIDISSQGMQRHSSFTIPFGSRHLGSPQPAATIDSDSLCTKLQSRGHTLFHRPSEGDAPFQLEGNVFSNELCINFWFTNFQDINDHFTFCNVSFEFFLEFINFRTFLANDDAGAGGVND